MTAGIDSYTKLMLHCDGANGSTAFRDSSLLPHTLTAAGNAQISTAQSVFGAASAAFDGTGDYLSTSDHADWYLATSDFTIDFCVRFNSIAASAGLIQQYTDDDNRWGIAWSNGGTLNLIAKASGVVTILVSVSWTPTVDTWYHLAFVRSGSDFLVFIDGVSQSVSGSPDADTFPDLGSNLWIGRFDVAGSNYLNGYLDEIRLSKGVARWTSNFTPPAAPYNTDWLVVGGAGGASAGSVIASGGFGSA